MAEDKSTIDQLEERIKQWFGQFFDEKVPFSEIGIMDNQVNDTPHTERRH